MLPVLSPASVGDPHLINNSSDISAPFTDPPGSAGVLFKYSAKRGYGCGLGVFNCRAAAPDLVLRILIGLVIGALLGLFCPQCYAVGILGKVFVSALKAIAPVLVAVLVTASIAKAKGGLGPRFRTVITLYMFTTFMAAVVALVGSFMFPVTMRLRHSLLGHPCGCGIALESE